MRTAVLALVALAALPAAAAAADPVIGLRPARTGDASELLRLRPSTLAPAAPPLRLRDTEPEGYAVAPDGRRVAVATARRALIDKPRVTILSLRSWRRRATIRLTPRDGAVVALEWLRPDRVLAFQRSPTGDGPLRITVIDPLARRVVGTADAPAAFGAPRAAGDRVVLFDTQPDGRTNQVLVLDADGREAGRVDAGDLSGAQPVLSLDGSTPASATVDPATGHALLLAATAPVLVDVDPVALTATRHEFAAVAPEGVEQTWVEGAADATRLAFSFLADDRGRSRLVPVDRATLTPGAPVTLSGFNGPVGAGDTVLVPSSSISQSSLKGLRAYGLDGVRRFTAEPRHRSTAAERYGAVIYAEVQGVGSTILDARTGRTLRRGPRRSLQIFERTPQYEAQQPWFGFGGAHAAAGG